MIFHVKQNDRRPYLRTTLKRLKGDGTTETVNLTSAPPIVFHMRPAGGGAPKVSGGTVVVVTAASGLVEYRWQSGDTDTVGRFEGEFQITWPTDEPETFPNGSYVPIVIGDDVA